MSSVVLQSAILEAEGYVARVIIRLGGKAKAVYPVGGSTGETFERYGTPAYPYPYPAAYPYYGYGAYYYGYGPCWGWRRHWYW